MKSGYYALLLSLLFIFSQGIHAQGVYQFWGLTKNGGTDNVGTLFSSTATGNNYQSRHNFTIANMGTYPQLTSLVEYNGRLYGMTQQGGINNSGIIFEWNPATNIYTKKFAFNGTNGSGPLGGLVWYNGKFYGMTENGGGQGQGVIFEWDPNTNLYTKKFDFTDNVFDGYNGYRPSGNLTMRAGKFYGMTTYGGNNDKGVIFEWNPVSNVYSKKVDFNGINGCRPFGNLTLGGEIFYGMTTLGGSNDKGVIFEWNPATNNYSKKIDFDGNNGSNPYGNLVDKDGVFISVTQHGGINDAGIIFEWDPSLNIFTKKYDFNETDGYWPSGDLTKNGGKFYGTAFRGGLNDAGIIFEWDPAINLFIKMNDFGSVNGKYPQAGLTWSNGKFYGMTNQGGNFDKGVIFEWAHTSNAYTKKIDLNDVGKGIYPTGSIIPAEGKLYGMTSLGGNNNAGVIFEWDKDADSYTKKIDLSVSTGSKPTGCLTYNAGKMYGMTKEGGNNNGGVIFEWDQAANTYTKKIDLIYQDGISPQGSLVWNGGKFYGMTNSGGSNGQGVIFEWDPVANIYTNKIDLSITTGSKPFGDLAAYNGKFYGMTNKGGNNNVGVIFEWDPVTNVYTKKIDLSISIGRLPNGSLSLYSQKFYGMTASGGTNNKGVIFEWDPATNFYTKKLDFSNTDTYSPQGNLILNAGKFYGMTRDGGSNNAGVIFEWDPVSNVYNKKRDLDASSGGSLPGGNTDISLAPAPVAKGIPGSCVSFPVVTIDNTNYNEWVPITDDLGNAVAEIKANGNNLGMLNSSMFIQNGSVREDGNNRLYLDRNITITPEFPIAPGSTVDIRLYIRNAEYMALKSAVNSNGQSSGIGSIHDIGVFKNNDACSNMVGLAANPISATAGVWESDYVFTASISSFSTFYFANSAQGGPLPLSSLEFRGRLVNNNGEITWKTTDEFNVRSFDLERSTDGRTYKTITKVTAANQQGIHLYNYSDKNIISLGVPVVYYRLRQTDMDSRYTYTGIVALNIKGSNLVKLYPNPVADKANLTITINRPEQVQAMIIDNAGRLVKQLALNVSAGSTSLSIDVSTLAAGVYYLELKGETLNEHKQFIKQ